jgi:anthranilate phosphoribosyltransferase
MFAPAHHATMKHVGPTRAELGIRTIFNLLGPLSNPAGVKRQVVGVFSKSWLEPLAHVLKNLGSETVWLCHGEDGMDEIIPSGTTWITELKDGNVRSFSLTPEEAGITRSIAVDLKGGDAVHNAAALRSVLDGHPSAYTDAALMTAAAAFVVAGKSRSVAEGVNVARESIVSGAARIVLEKLAKVSHS